VEHDRSFDVSMTFFLPLDQADGCGLGPIVHLVLGRRPAAGIRTGQPFGRTCPSSRPKTVQTADERQKLSVFGFKARIGIPPCSKRPHSAAYQNGACQHGHTCLGPKGPNGRARGGEVAGLSSAVISSKTCACASAQTCALERHQPGCGQRLPQRPGGPMEWENPACWRWCRNPPGAVQGECASSAATWPTLAPSPGIRPRIA